MAAELYEKTKGAIKIKWYSTHGEQYHTKLTAVRYSDSSVIIGGSANLTKRNIGDYNLETDLKIIAPNDSNVATEVDQYFDRIWSNSNGTYTVDFEHYYERSLGKKILYRLQEWSGLSTF